MVVDSTKQKFDFKFSILNFDQIARTSFNPNPLSIVARVDECAEYIYNDLFIGFKVPSILCAVRSSISFIRNPERSRTKSVFVFLIFFFKKKV